LGVLEDGVFAGSGKGHRASFLGDRLSVLQICNAYLVRQTHKAHFNSCTTVAITSVDAHMSITQSHGVSVNGPARLQGLLGLHACDHV
jgi:hypothetical protein